MSYGTYLNYETKYNGKSSLLVNTMLARIPDAFPEIQTVPDGWDLEKKNGKAAAKSRLSEPSCFEGFPGTTDAWL